jgi:hypothetical protein
LLVGLLFALSQPVVAAGTLSRDVSFQSSGYRLQGTLTSPDGQPAVAGILIIPGSGPVDRDGASRVAPSLPPIYRQWAERLSDNGYVVLRYDKRFLTHSDIDIRTFDQEAQIADALAAAVFLRTVANRIFLLGHSEGGTLAPLVAERIGGVAGVAVVNTVQFPVDELVVAQMQAWPDVPRETVEEVRRFLAQVKDGSFPKRGLLLGAGANYWAQWIAYSRASQQTLSRLPVPLLLVQCLKDETLPGDTLARNQAILRGVLVAKKDAQLHELPGHDHFGMLPGIREPSPGFMRVLLDWLNANR